MTPQTTQNRPPKCSKGVAVEECVVAWLACGVVAGLLGVVWVGSGAVLGRFGDAPET